VNYRLIIVQSVIHGDRIPPHCVTYVNKDFMKMVKCNAYNAIPNVLHVKIASLIASNV